MSRNARPTRDFLGIIDRRLSRGRPGYFGDLEQARLTAAMAREAYDLREKAGLSRSQLARKVSTTTDVIRRLEEDDYDDENRLRMLQRIAHALGRRIEIRVLPASTRKRPA